MGIDGIGSSVVIALAAVLWFVYLVPTWLRRREYLATERNAVRLQRTMRIMAESAELPAVVRVEATARSVAMQEKALRKEQQLAMAVERAQAAASARSLSRTAAYPLPEGSRSERLEGGHRSSRRLRRSRAFASFVLLASVVAAGFGVNVLLVTGAWALLAAVAAVALGAVVLLGQMAAVAKARTELARAVRTAPVASQLRDHAEVDQPLRQPGWTPVPLPKPLYLSRPVSASFPEGVVARESLPEGSRGARSSRRAPTEVLDPVASLRAAALAAERALRAAQASPEVARISRPATTSRFASMGVVDQTDVVKTDLDAILSRRRAAG